MIFVKISTGGREVNMINTLSKINLSKIGWEGGRSTSIGIMSLNILFVFFDGTPVPNIWCVYCYFFYCLFKESIQGFRAFLQSWFQKFVNIQYIFLPSSVLGCSVTHPVCMYSTSCLNTSGSNSSMIRVSCCSPQPPC